MPEGAVYVGRPTRWGNPVAVGSEFDWFPVGRRLHATITTLEEVIDYYRLWIEGLHPDERPPCHGDVLLEVANR